MSDPRHWTRPQLLWWLAAALVACGLKRHYSVASAAELAWMLRPVAMLLQLITGYRFHASAAGEWQSETAGIVLVKGCAGINFMILSFIGWCWLARPSRQAPLTLATVCIEWPVLLAASLLLAWAAALTINVLRILTAMSLGPLLNAWLGPEEVHRLFGLAIYLPALALQLTAGERQNRGSAALVATGSYVALMVVTPLLTGNAFDQLTDYVRQSTMVLLLVAPVAAWGLRTKRNYPL